MSQKQQMLAGAGVLIIVVLIGLAIYSQSSQTIPSRDLMVGSNSQVDAIEQESRESVVPAATPDATVDAILNDASTDDQAMTDEVATEQDAVTASGDEINNLTQTYDENQL